MNLGSATENALAWELHAWSVYATANDSAAARFGDAGGTKKERAPRGVPQGAASHGRPVLTGRNGESAAARRSGTHKNEEAPCRLGRGPRESSSDLLSRARGPGTIGDLRLNFRVRDGNGCDPHSITAETISMTWKKTFIAIARMPKPGGSGLPTRDS